MNFDELGEKLGEEIEKKVKSKGKTREITDAAEIKEILSAVSGEVPALIKNIFSAIYDPEIATNYGKGIVALHEQLTGKGLPDDMVREIIMNFSKSFDIVGKALKSNISINSDDD